jgi:peptide/nickel transport system ATP-binding protein
VQGVVSHLLEVEDLRVTFKLDEGLLEAVNGVNLTVERGKTLGLVGESGCGKSVAVQAVMRITPSPGVVNGKILLQTTRAGQPRTVDLAKLSPTGREVRAIRGKDIAMIFQEPMTSFSPLYTIGNQIMEAILLHKTTNQREAREITLQMLDKVGISNPAQRIDEYPHQLSGGMRQRAMIAMALSCDPSLLIADEPTTALDVTVQAQVMELMKSLQQQYGMAMLYITHDLGVIAEMADEMAVMYLGKIVEQTDVRSLFREPLHPYTAALLRSIPQVGRKARVRLDSIKGSVPVPINLPKGCGFFSRCREAMPGVCDRDDPILAEVKPGHLVRCFLYPQVRDAAGSQQAGEARKVGNDH